MPQSPDPRNVASQLKQIESTMRKAGMWQNTPIDPAAIENMSQAFGADTMSFQQWIQFVLVPRVNQIIEEGGDFPPESNVGAYAVREFDGNLEASDLIQELIKFDDLFNPPMDESTFMK